jgi:GNAT superfamily N-acetyltransferase
MLQIIPAESEAQYRQVRDLLAELTEWDMSQVERLGLDAQKVLQFYYASGDQALPGEYAPPEGRMLLATYSAKAAGCAAFHCMTPGICEIKRMYVRPEFRRLGIGRQLAQALIPEAREAGYGIMRLETTTFMDKAITMYLSLGFRTCEAYYPIPESFRAITVFMELDLAAIQMEHAGPVGDPFSAR